LTTDLRTRFDHSTVDRGVIRVNTDMKPKTVRLFVKPSCGWCHEAQDWLEEREIEFESLDVTSDARARQEMFDLSGQSLAPVIEVDGEVLADFDTDQLEAFWKKLKKSAA
jgi:glutaredoxin 3